MPFYPIPSHHSLQPSFCFTLHTTTAEIDENCQFGKGGREREREREREACVVVDKWFGPLIWWAHISPKQNIDTVGPPKLVAPPPSSHAFSEKWGIFKGRPDSPDRQIKRKRGLFYFVRPLTGFSLSRRVFLLFKGMFSFIYVPRITVVVAVAFWSRRHVAFSLILFY